MRTTTFSGFDRIPDAVRVCLARRGAEFAGSLIICLAIAVALALATWSAQDPSLNYASEGAVRNVLGAPGALFADIIMQLWGISTITLFAPAAYWGWLLLTHRRLDRVPTRIGLLLCGSVCAAAIASLLPVTDRWPMPTGLGGVIGDAALALPRMIVGGFSAGMIVVVLIFGVCAIVALSAAAAPVAAAEVADDLAEERASGRRRERSEEEDELGEPSLALVTLGAVVHAGFSLRMRVSRLIARVASGGKNLAEVQPERNRVRREPVFETPVSAIAKEEIRSAAPLPLRDETPMEPESHRIVDAEPARIKSGNGRYGRPPPRSSNRC